jgi:integrase/recombinase XerD
MNWQTRITEFLDQIQDSRNASQNTILAYRNDLGQFTSYLTRTMPEDATWDNVNDETLSGYIASLTTQNYSKATTARKVAALKSLFHWMGKQGAVAQDPSISLKSPKVDKLTPRVLSEEEVERLFAATGNNPLPRSLRDRALLELIYSTGMRVSEAISLRLTDVDMENAEVKCAGRGTRNRRAPLTASAQTALQNYINQSRPATATNQPNEFLFLNPAGSNLTRQAVWLMTRQYARYAGIEGEITPHTLRHSRAAHMLQGGEDVRKVQSWLGHANITTTQAYHVKRDKAAD